MTFSSSFINIVRKKTCGLIPTACMLTTVIMLLASCSTTKNLREGDQLFIGLEKIKFTNINDSIQPDHLALAKEEVEASLATAPNGALFGSSYYRTPFPYGLWVWNAFSGSKNKIAQWITKTFGKAPVLMRQVNPELRASVAQSVLRSHGYMNGKVDFKIIQQKNPKKAKIGYTVDFGQLYTVDTLEYVNFPQTADSLIRLSQGGALVKTGDPLPNATDLQTYSAITDTIITNPASLHTLPIPLPPPARPNCVCKWPTTYQQ